MKKIISWILLAATLLGLFAGCGASKAPETQPSAAVESTAAPEAPVLTENNAADVIAYLRTIYKDSGSKTSGNFERFGIVRIAGVPYEVVWTANVGSEKVMIYAGENGMTVIDVNEKCTEDTLYTLTATVTDANGNTESADWEYLLPGAASLEELQAIVDQAYALAVGEAMSEEKALRGVISSIDTVWSEQYQNITVSIIIEGREDKPIMCYRLKGDGAADLVVGDTITVQGILKNYNNKIEFDAGCKLTIVEKTGTAIEIPTDMVQILDDVYALGNNESLPYGPVTLVGSICSIEDAYSEQYKNITVTIRMGYYTIKCYRMKGAGVEDLEMNDIITVKGRIKKYNGVREFDQPELIDVVKVGPYAQPKDQLEVVKAAYDLDPAWMLPYSPVTLTGTITSPGTWSEQYQNRNVTFVVDGDTDSKYPMYCYRMTYSDDATKEAIKNLSAGDKITVEGMVIKHVYTKNGEATGETKVQMIGSQLIKHTPKPNPDKGPFNKITKASELVSGKYVMMVSTGYAPGNLDGTWVSATQPVVEGDVVTDSKNGVWTLSVYGDQVKITDAAGNTIAPKGGNTNGISGDKNTKYKWNWTCNADGTFTFSGVGDDTVKLASNNSTDAQYGGFHKFRAYKNTTITSNAYPCNFTLYLKPGSEFEPGTDEGDSETYATLTVAEAIALGASKGHNVYTEEKYYVTGVITEIYNTTYGNMKITDDAGNILTIYGTYDSTGANRFDAMTTQPVVGDTVKLLGIIGQYSGTPQMKNGWIIQIGVEDTSSSIKDGQYAIYAPGYGKAATALASSSNYGYLPSVTASVADDKLVCDSESVWFTLTNNADGSFTLQDASGRYYYMSGTYNSFNVTTSKPTDGSADWVLEEVDGGTYIKNVAKSKYISYASNYSNFGAYADPGTNSIMQLVAKGSVTPPVDPQPPVSNDPAADSTLTIPEAVALGTSKEHNTYTSNKYYVTGVVDAISSTTYGNMVIKDANGNSLTIYGTYDATGANRFDAMTTQPAVGNTVKLYGIIGQYNGTAQMKNAWLIECSGSVTPPVDPTPDPDPTPDTPVNPPAATETSYVKVTSADDFTTGKYVMVVSNGSAPTTFSSGWVLTGTPTVSDGVITTENAAGYIWDITVSGSSAVLTDANGVTIAPKSGNTNGIQSKSYNWAWVFSNGTFNFKGINSDTTTFACNTDKTNGLNKFRAYKNTTVSGNPSTYQANFTLYKLVEATAEPELAVSTIAEALAAETGKELKITGYVNMVEGSKVYVQDATGAILVNLASSGAKKGDTFTFTGTKAAGATLTGTAAEKAETALTQFVTTEKLLDVSTDVHLYHYMSIDNELTVLEEQGDYILVADEEDNQIRIFDPVCSEPAKLIAGAVISYKGILTGESEGFMVFQNTDAAEITIVKEAVTEPVGPAEPVAHVVDFESITTSNSNGGDSSYTKTFKTASGWTVTNSAIQVGGASDVNPQFKVVGPDNSYKAVCMNGKTSAPGKITSPTLKGGITKLAMDYTKMFTDTKLSVTIKITDLSNGQTYSKTVSREEDKNTKYVVWSFVWELETPINGDFTIEIVNDCPSNNSGNKDRFTILDMVWYSKG